MELQNVENIYPLSYLQESILLNRLKMSKADLSCGQFICTLHGMLDVLAFEQAWQQVIDRQPLLRTYFVWQRVKNPLQVVHKQVKFSLDQQDWRCFSLTQQEEKLEHYINAKQVRSFNLAKPPLIHIMVCHTDEYTYQFAWIYDSLILDSWSVFLILKEVFALYDSSCRGENFSLTQICPYRDYVMWLRQQDLSQAEEFWNQLLKGFTRPTPLVVDRVFNNLTDRRENNNQLIRLSVTATERLRSLAQEQQINLKTLVQGAWAMLLSRYNDNDDVVFGITVSSRLTTLSGIECMVGLLDNILPIRVRVPAQAQLLHWLKEFQNQQLELQKYQCTPSFKIQNWSEISSGLPLFESLLIFEDFTQKISCENLEIQNIRLLLCTNYPLTLVVKLHPELSLQIIYDKKRFDSAVILRMLGHIQTLLENFGMNPNQRLSTVPLISKAELRQLEKWSYA
ncbi:condensation domain-containing protein [Nostoc sp. CCY 9925]|uniref:condensation domain-containing protein n=1 Tax=Nostoc sp. CCY 9925 TaxID=3103865 RepID=UPI0039C6E8A4